MRVLYFYPENPLNSCQGNNSRALSLLNYFKDRNIALDFVAEKTKNLQLNDIQPLISQGLAKNVFVLDEFRRDKNKIKYFFYQSLPRTVKGEIKDFNRLKINQLKCFEDIIRNGNYDYVIISYAYWHSLIIKYKHLDTKFIVDTHDFLTSQFQNSKKFSLGRYFEKEIKSLNKFDELFVISPEEKYIFSQFIDKPIHLVTHSLHSKPHTLEKKYDLLYVASDNQHNVKSIKWFLEEVYPKLPSTVKMIFIGKICNHIPFLPNIETLNHVENIETYYNESKIVLCPMLSGTGLKIKVIEGLSYGLPVVCTERGIDGLINKTNNGCLVCSDASSFEANIIKLIKNNEFYTKVNLEAKKYFEENHSVASVFKMLDSIFKK